MDKPKKAPPKFLHLEITSECNLRCKQCNAWLNRDSKDKLTIDEKKDLIEQFYRLNRDGVVVLIGGEPTLKVGEFFVLTNFCRQLKIMCVANTNATMINSRNIKRFLFEGPNWLIISLDSHIEKIHDIIRGVRGTYRHTVEVMKELIETKIKYPEIRTKIITNSVLSERNIYELDKFILFAKKIFKIDHIMFQILSKTFYNSKTGDKYFEDNFFKDKEKAKGKIDKILRMYDKDDFVMIKKRDMESMKAYIDNPYLTKKPICGSYEKNLMVDHRGNVTLCFFSRGLGNIREHSLKYIWNFKATLRIRQEMSQCRLGCGALNCHRKDAFIDLERQYQNNFRV